MSGTARVENRPNMYFTSNKEGRRGTLVTATTETHSNTHNTFELLRPHMALPSGTVFRQVDANNDGFITRSEWSSFTEGAVEKPSPRPTTTRRVTPLSVAGTTPALAWYDSSRVGKTEKQQRYEDLRKAIFQSLDADGSYTITRGEFISALTRPSPSTHPSIWRTMNEAEAARIFDDITTGRGKVTLAKLDGWVVSQALHAAIHKYRAAKGEDKQLEKPEFVRFLEGEGAPRNVAERLWHRCDTNRNGRVNLMEFRDWAGDLLKLGVLEEKFGTH